jgi:2'-5' RNA ligase
VLRSAVVVAVPEAAAAVDAWRERTCEAKPSAGVPPHVTLAFPFVPAAEVDDALLAELRTRLASYRSFVVELRRTARFPQVLYLEPEPGERFVELARAVGDRSGDPIPHLTVAQGGADVLDAAEADVAPRLPISARVDAVVLLEEVEPEFARWRERARLALDTR